MFKKVQFHFSFLFILSFVLFVGLLVYASRVIFANNYILGQLNVAGIEIGGMSYSEASDALQKHYSSFLDQEVKVVVQDELFYIKVRDLGVEFDIFQTMEEAYQISFGENIGRHMQARLLSFVEDTTLKPAIHIDRDIFVNSITSQFPQIRDPREALVYVDDNGLVNVRASKQGFKVDFDALYKQFTTFISAFTVPVLYVDVEPIEPTYTQEAANQDAALLASLLQQEIHLTQELDSPVFSYTLTIPPDWVTVKNSKLYFYEDRIGTYLTENLSSQVDRQASDVQILALPQDGNPRAQLEGTLSDGRRINIEGTVSRITESIKKNVFDIPLDIEIISAKIVNETGQNLGEFKLIARGLSNFKGSPDGRAFNIRKALSERINGVVFAPGQEFSYNDVIDNLSDGWKQALGIFGGVNLSPVLGGGLCQVSTTVYRAALNAGLKITERYAHSLHVHYYKQGWEDKKGWDGLDSTIFLGGKNLRFLNDTPSYILVLAGFDDKDNAYVDFYGISDGRKIDLFGPYYSKTEIPAEFQEKVGGVAWNQIKWVQRITRSDGNIEENVIVSTYIKGVH